MSYPHIYISAKVEDLSASFLQCSVVDLQPNNIDVAPLPRAISLTLARCSSPGYQAARKLQWVGLHYQKVTVGEVTLKENYSG